jgi:hypothetical protein
MSKNYKMYKKAGCSRCNKGQKIYGGATSLDITYFERCSCANIKRKKYKNFLKNKDKLKKELTACDFEILENKWYDNNSYIIQGNDSVDRSW